MSNGVQMFDAYAQNNRTWNTKLKLFIQHRLSEMWPRCASNVLFYRFCLVFLFFMCDKTILFVKRNECFGSRKYMCVLFSLYRLFLNNMICSLSLSLNSFLWKSFHQCNADELMWIWYCIVCLFRVGQIFEIVCCLFDFYWHFSYWTKWINL